MEISNIILGKAVSIDSTTSINNLKIGDNVKISKYCSIFGSKDHILTIGSDSYIGMFSILNGYSALLTIGSRVSIAQNVNIMTDSGPNASHAMQEIFPIIKNAVYIDDDCWIGTGVIIMPGVVLGRSCVVAANSFVNSNFLPYSIIGGNPAKLIRILTSQEILKITTNSSK